MQIKTKTFAPTYDELVKLFTKDYFRKYKIIYAYPLIIPVAFYFFALWTAIAITAIISYSLYMSITYYKRYFKDPKNAIFFEKREMEFTDEHIWAGLESGSESTNVWDDFIGYRTEDELILIQLSKVQYYIIPPSAFEAGDREILLNFLKDNFNQ